ncbi:MAG: hypothetical protein EBX50_21130, partial [Chitinophagia bacterium]|nr:hypothetical protein [Chitinophagia bacterium]
MAPIGGLLGDSNGKYVISKADKDGLCQLLNSWFRIGIALAGMLAVVMIVLGGFQYATTDAMSSKEDGKGKIQNALWGLLLALTTWLVISTINPDLTKCTINAGEVKLGKVTSTSGVSNDGVLNRSSNTLATGSTGDSTKSQSEIEAEYNKVYSQWTDADDEELASGSKTAEEKWNSVQSQIDSLNTKYATQKSSGSGVVGSANQKILSEISAGNKSSSTNCFESAVCLAKDAGVTYSR